MVDRGAADAATSTDRDWLLEHRYRAVLEVVAGQPVTEVAARFGVSRQSVHAWKRRYESDGLDGLREVSRRPHTSPSRIGAGIEARICEMRRAHQRWGARRISFELARAGITPTPSRATVHRVLVRNGLIDPQAQQHRRKYTRWQREAPMQLWQLDIVDGMRLANGRQCKIVTGIDDHWCAASTSMPSCRYRYAVEVPIVLSAANCAIRVPARNQRNRSTAWAKQPSARRLLRVPRRRRSARSAVDHRVKHPQMPRCAR